MARTLVRSFLGCGVGDFTWSRWIVSTWMVNPLPRHFSDRLQAVRQILNVRRENEYECKSIITVYFLQYLSMNPCQHG
jgi:hypothetical protein